MSTPIVTVQQGKLKGDVGTNLNGEEFFKFHGIPYAKPPVGDLRFKAPVAADSWEGVRDATKEGDICISRCDLTRNIQGSEDCLTLNVYTKELQSGTSLKPVMVYIHGGGFTMGSSRASIYGPEFLLTKDIVLVTINYRLGILGFLSLDDTSLGVPGNAGLKDQSLALKWVQKNIQKFNGDPNNVTIFGESAGAASVHFQIISPTSKGLFHKAILQSGCVLSPWAWGSKNNAIEITKALGKEAKTENEALDILRDTPYEKLFEAQEKFYDSLTPAKKRAFGPVVETPNDTAFLTKSPIDLLSSGKYNHVPMIIGYTSREGMILELFKFFAHICPLPEEELKLSDMIPWYTDIMNFSDICQKVNKKFQEIYFKGRDENDNKYQLLTDGMFVAGLIKAIRHHLKTGKNPIYFYRMSVESKLNFLKNLGQMKAPGVCHADDLGYLFKSQLTPDIKPGSLEDNSLRIFVHLWTSFAKYGNPTPSNELNITWPSLKDENNLVYLDIGEKLTLGTNPDAERMAVWNEIWPICPTANFM